MAWPVLAFLIGATLLAVPRVDAMFRDPWALAARYHAPEVAGFFSLGLWAATLWHAAVVPKRRALQRVVILAVLALGSIIAAFLYYFLYLHWAMTAQTRDATVAAV